MTVMQATTDELQMANGPDGKRQLERLMMRASASMTPRGFLEDVTRIYQHVKREHDPVEMANIFRQSRSHDVFVEGLRQASDRLPSSPSVLVLGCESHLAGDDASYAAKTTQQMLDGIGVKRLVRQDIGFNWPCDAFDGQPASECSPFDLVVSHSLVHFVVELGPLLQRVQQLTADGGIYVMAHEPNATFWRSTACQTILRRWERRQRLRKRLRRFLAPARYLTSVRRRLQSQTTSSLADKVNHRLRQQLGLTAELTYQELSRVADPHRPTGGSEQFRVGLDGLDCDEIERQWLTAFHLEWMRTYDHLGYNDVDRLPGRWQRIVAKLQESHPRDGAVLTALWRKGEQRVRD